MRMVLSNENLQYRQKLGELAPGDRAEIVGFCGDEDLHDFLQRLFEVGFLVGEKIEVLREAPFSRDPISVRVKEATYALRRQDANLIFVKNVQGSA